MALHVGNVTGIGSPMHALERRCVRNGVLRHARLSTTVPRAGDGSQSQADDAESASDQGAGTGVSGSKQDDEFGTADATTPIDKLGTAGKQGKDFFDLMGFAGSAPEIVNVRLGALGFIGGMTAELRTHTTLKEQAMQAPWAIGAAIGLVTLGSFAPEFFGNGMEPRKAKNSPPFFTEKAELTNCRLATWALLAIAIIESGYQTSFF